MESKGQVQTFAPAFGVDKASIDRYRTGEVYGRREKVWIEPEKINTLMFFETPAHS